VSQVQQKTLEEMRQILADAKTVAVVGLSDKRDRPSYGVAAYLQQQGYRIIPVNPNLTAVLGERAYPAVTAIPTEIAIDVVEIFRRPEHVPPVVEEAIAVGAKVVWMQQGIVHEAAAQRAEEAGLTVVMDACMAAVHRHLRTMGKI
jgi:hypothetical protein